MSDIVLRTAGFAKRVIAKAIANDMTGAVAAFLLHDRIRKHGLILNTHSPLLRNEVKARMLFGLYESAERRMITRHMRRDLPVVELGASIGYISTLIARLRPPSQVSVEANPYLLPLIDDVLRANGMTGVRVVHAAIDYSGRPTVELDLGLENTEAAVVSNRRCRTGNATIDVPATTLATLLKKEGIGDYVLVCDIEGAEVAMMRLENSCAATSCQQMIIEIHDHCRTGESPAMASEVVVAIQSRWGMLPVCRDGNVWLFERAR
jgi:FkbM family methyltransferase